MARPSPRLARRRRTGRERGFTLIELALVVMIIGILLALVVPRLPSLGRTDLEGAADRLATTMTYLADEASLRGRIYRLTVDLDAGTWQVAALTPYAEPDGSGAKPEFRLDDDDPMARSVTLPPGVAFEAVIDHDGETASGQKAVYFLPEGVVEDVGVRLSEDGGATTTVVLDATRGEAHRGDTVEVPE